MALNYPYDPSGSNASNLIQNELHSVQPPANISQASFIVPRVAPFFKESFEIWTQPNRTGVRLREGTDYFFTHKFVTASEFLGRTIYGGVAFIDQTRTGNVYLTYQTLGGDFINNDTTILEALSRKLYQDVRFVTWDQLSGVPSAFPPNPHRHSLNDVSTLRDLVESLNGIVTAILAMGSGGGAGGSGGDNAALLLIQNHLSKGTGSHTPEQVGLGNVLNYGLANEEDLRTLKADKYINPPGVKKLLEITLAEKEFLGAVHSIEHIKTELDQLLERLEQFENIDENLQSELAAIQEDIGALTSKVNLLNGLVSGLSTGVDNSQAIAVTANSLAATVTTNLENAINRINEMLYAGTHSYSVGSHRIAIPGRTKLRITLVGGGGGSGSYYTSMQHCIRSPNKATAGEKSVVYALGFKNQPIEPYPLAVSFGGGAGEDSWQDSGRANGGVGGYSIIVKDKVLATEIVNDILPLDELKKIPGEVGSAGDSQAAIMNPVGGVGGVKLNDSGDLSKLTFGKGRGGVNRAGLGGASAKATIVIENNTDKDFFINVVVGKGGCNSGNLPNIHDNEFESNGFAHTLLVS